MNLAVIVGRSEVGRIEVITGPMFSGKSEELIRRLKRARIARQRMACFKPDIDLRYHRTAIASHSAQTHEAVTVANVAHLREALYPQLEQVEVIGIDEGQFFDPAIVHLAGELVHMGKRIVIAGLDTTFSGDPFRPDSRADGHRRRGHQALRGMHGVRCAGHPHPAPGFQPRTGGRGRSRSVRGPLPRMLPPLPGSAGKRAVGVARRRTASETG